MANRPSAQNEIETLRKRQQMGPFLIGGVAVVLLIVAILILVVWMTGPNGPKVFHPATDTPTPTNTSTATRVPPTATPTLTPTVTETPTNTLTPTPSGPFEYTVVEGDNCWAISQKYKADLNVLIALNNWKAGQCPIKAGDTILIPLPDQVLASPTVPPPGVKIDVTYVIQSGDTLASIAIRYSSTVAAILAKNTAIKNQNDIKVGQTIIIPANIATAVPTLAPTSTHVPLTATATKQPPTATATQKP